MRTLKLLEFLKKENIEVSSIYPYNDSDKEFIGAIAIYKDISDKIRLKELAEYEKYKLLLKVVNLNLGYESDNR